MKKKELTETKNLNIKALGERAKKLRAEIADLVMDKNLNTLKDKKSISKKRKDLAQVLTVLRQKELIGVLESQPEADRPLGEDESNVEKKGEQAAA